MPTYKTNAQLYLTDMYAPERKLIIKMSPDRETKAQLWDQRPTINSKAWQKCMHQKEESLLKCPLTGRPAPNYKTKAQPWIQTPDRNACPRRKTHYKNVRRQVYQSPTVRPTPNYTFKNLAEMQAPAKKNLLINDVPSQVEQCPTMNSKP